MQFKKWFESVFSNWFWLGLQMFALLKDVNNIILHKQCCLIIKTNIFEGFPWILTIFWGAYTHSWPPIALKALLLLLITVITPIRLTIGAETVSRADAQAPLSISLSLSLFESTVYSFSQGWRCAVTETLESEKAKWHKEQEEWMIMEGGWRNW